MKRIVIALMFFASTAIAQQSFAPISEALQDEFLRRLSHIVPFDDFTERVRPLFQEIEGRAQREKAVADAEAKKRQDQAIAEAEERGRQRGVAEERARHENE